MYKGDALVTAVKEHFPGASVTRCERGQVDVDLVLGVDSFSLDKALEVSRRARELTNSKVLRRIYCTACVAPIL